MIYLDNAATAPVSQEARQAALQAMEIIYANPSSPHEMGIAAERAIKKAACTLAFFLKCQPEEIIFTSGGTESNNLALLGAARVFNVKNKRQGRHILASPLEHASVTEPLRILAEEGFDIDFAPVDQWAKRLREETVLVTFSQVSGETGDTHDIAKVAALVKARNPSALIHVDGAQGFCKLPTALSQVDLYSWSAHKIHGLKGSGGLMVRRGVRLLPLLWGGGQQNGLRPGTENTPGILAMSAAAAAFGENWEAHYAHVSRLNHILSSLTELLPQTFCNHSAETASPYILNMSFLGVNGETLVHLLSEQGIYASMGAACRVKKGQASPLTALGFEKTRVQSAVRFSFSPLNTLHEAEAAREAIIKGVQQLRAIKPAGRVF